MPNCRGRFSAIQNDTSATRGMALLAPNARLGPVGLLARASKGDCLAFFPLNGYVSAFPEVLPQ